MINIAKLYFRYSSMNSGKTSQLIQVAYNYEERGMKILTLKPKIDTKGNNKIVSRLGVSRNVDILVSKDMNIFERIKEVSKTPNALLIDEVQFLTEKQVNQLMQIVVQLNIPIICYGLRTDFKTNGFEGSSRLLDIAHSIEELKTICRCGKKAIFNARKINGKFVFEGNQVEIDNQDNIEYESLCADCYYKYKEGEFKS